MVFKFMAASVAHLFIQFCLAAIRCYARQGFFHKDNYLKVLKYMSSVCIFIASIDCISPRHSLITNIGIAIFQYLQ